MDYLCGDYILGGAMACTIVHQGSSKFVAAYVRFTWINSRLSLGPAGLMLNAYLLTAKYDKRQESGFHSNHIKRQRRPRKKIDQAYHHSDLAPSQLQMSNRQVERESHIHMYILRYGSSSPPKKWIQNSDIHSHSPSLSILSRALDTPVNNTLSTSLVGLRYSRQYQTLKSNPI